MCENPYKAPDSPPEATAEASLDTADTRRSDQWLAGCLLGLVLGLLGAVLTMSLFVAMLPKDACGTGVGAFSLAGLFLGLLFFGIVGLGLGWQWAKRQGGARKPSRLPSWSLQRVRPLLVVLSFALAIALIVSAPGFLPLWGILGFLAVIALEHRSEIGDSLAVLMLAILGTLAVLVCLTYT